MLWEVMTSYWFSRCRCSVAAQSYLRFRIRWHRYLEKLKVFQHTRFRQDSSIHGRDITTSGLVKQKSTILKFFWFRFRPHHCNRPAILHHVTDKFRPNRADVMMSCRLLPPDAMHKRGLCRHAVSVCLFVCLCVCLSRSWVVSKRVIVSSDFFYRRV